MSGSHRYLDALESFHTMLTNYPTQAEMAAIHVAMDPECQVTVAVRLADAEPAVLAAGLVDWYRTLCDTELWAWRTPNGDDVHLAVVGVGTECDETPVVVAARPIPYGYLDCHLEPDTAERLDSDALYLWLGTEITRAWPFTRAEPVT